jgi:hypothetical protein
MSRDQDRVLYFSREQMHWCENMSARKNPGVTWHQAEIPIRSDIYKKASDLHLDIRDECNRALAHIVGIDYSREPSDTESPSEPVTIATVPVAETGSALKTPARTTPVSPVMNAEDPMAPVKVLRDKKEAAAPKPRAMHAPSATPAIKAPDKALPEESLTLADSPGKHSTDRKTKEGTIKKFVKTRIIRAGEESPDTVLPKDELFAMFERWCREQDIAKIPDRKAFTVALKNQYAFTERTIGGKPCWMNIQIR